MDSSIQTFSDGSTYQDLFNSYQNILRRIETTVGSDGKPIRLLAISKKQDNDKIKALLNLGHREFGENYWVDLEKRLPFFEDTGISWVFIGQLQSNKIAKIVKSCDEIQSLSSFKHAEQVAKYASKYNKTPFPVYLQLNPEQEKAKGGVSFQELQDLSKEVRERLPELDLKGVMSIPPKGDGNEERQKQLYMQIKGAAEKVGKGILSLGMSEDLEVAIQCGSQCVRIGRHLFGERKVNS